MIVYSQCAPRAADGKEDLLTRGLVSAFPQIIQQRFGDFLQERKRKSFASFLGGEVDQTLTKIYIPGAQVE
jgi:hypothetical protein